MTQTILITGATDGIGLEAAKTLASQGHCLLLHGRNSAKLKAAVSEVLKSGTLESGTLKSPQVGRVESYLADLSHMDEVEALAEAVAQNHDRLDVLINNAGILKAPNPVTAEGLDIRFAVNTLAPYLLTQRLLPLIEAKTQDKRAGRIVNLSSAAQSPVDLAALRGEVRLSEMEAYAQSKLAITAWSRHMALALKHRTTGSPETGQPETGQPETGNPVKESAENVPSILALNPGSLLATKMVKEGFGIEGSNIRIGADVIVRAALEDEFGPSATGLYFDNDKGGFAQPHGDAVDPHTAQELVDEMERLLNARRSL